MSTSPPLVKAVFVIDKSATPPSAPAGQEDTSWMSPEELEAESKLIHFFSPEPIERAEKRSLSGLIEGVRDFLAYCSNQSPNQANEADERMYVETEEFLIVSKPFGWNANVFSVIVFNNASLGGVSREGAKMMVDMYQSHFELLHPTTSPVKEMTGWFSDYTPWFVAAHEALPKYAGIRFGGIDRHCALAVHGLGLEILHEFKNIAQFAILYKGSLLATSLPNITDLAPLYTYLCLNTFTGEVSNTKLLSPPYGRLPTVGVSAAVSAYGRCNFFDPDNSSNGWLFGPTSKSGHSPFTPLIWLASDPTPTRLAAYIINGVMFILLFRNTLPLPISLSVQEGGESAMFTRLESYLVDNHQLNDEILPLIRSDLLSRAGKFEGVQFEYTNNVNGSLITSKGVKEGDSGNGWRSGLFSLSKLGARFSPFGSTGSGGADVSASATSKGSRGVQERIREVMGSDRTIEEIFVKPSSQVGWVVARSSGGQEGRVLEIQFQNNRVPLWKAQADVEAFVAGRFDSVFI